MNKTKIALFFYLISSFSALSVSSLNMVLDTMTFRCFGEPHERFWLCDGPYEGVLDRQDDERGFLPLLLSNDIPIIFGRIESIVWESSEQLLSEPIDFDERAFIDSNLIEYYHIFATDKETAHIGTFAQKISHFYTCFKAYIATLYTKQLIYCENGIYFSTFSLYKPAVLKPSDEETVPLYFDGLSKDEKELYEYRFDASGTKSLSLRSANKLFESIAQNISLAHQHYDGCHSRAHIIANHLHRKGIKTRKIWLGGRLKNPQDTNQEWAFHVAVMIFVSHGNDEMPMVIDVSLDPTKLLTVDEWLARNNVTSHALIHFPIPKAVGYFYEAALTLSSHIPLEPYFDDTHVSLSDSLKEARTQNKLHLDYVRLSQD